MQMYVARTTGYDRTRTVHLYRDCQTIRMKLEATAVEVRYPQEIDPRRPEGAVYRICAYCQARRDGKIIRTLAREVMAAGAK